ncbi:MAG: SIR2 family protein [Chloroflexi bacterium]|nr:SIR2 family protein [Chloroflexota bacterium]
MSDDYYLKIGSTDIFGENLLDNLSPTDEGKKKKAVSDLAERLKETRIRIGTLLKTDNVSFLIGAGASMDAGGVGLASIPVELEKSLHVKAEESGNGEDADWLLLFYAACSVQSGQAFSFRDRRPSLDGDPSEVNKIPINLEDYLSQLHIWRAGMSEQSTNTTIALAAGGSLTISRVAIDRLIKEIKHSLISLVNLPASGKESALRDHRRLIQKVLTRPLNLRRANLFTLNYDTLIEKAADAEGVILVDGFVGTLQRIFRPESYDIDFYFPAQTTEGRVHRLDRALHLYKLHGSITWHRSEESWENPYGVYATFYKQGTTAEDVLIYPSPLKYGQALGLPYSELFRRFGSAIAQPQSVLFTIGYGFGDAHVNTLIRQALAIPSFTLVVIDPAPTSDFVRTLRERGDERVWLVSGRELGCFRHFVEKLLPDLRDEEITEKVMKTYRALSPPVRTNDHDRSGDTDE